jgi:hypothetical protein
MKILILGGYGAVGREAAAALATRRTATVLVAGRNPGKAIPIPGTTAVRVDATDPAALAEALEGVNAVLMCTESGNAQVASSCLRRGIHYLDVTASHHLHQQIEDLDPIAKQNGATAVLSVGLVPGVTNLLARHCVAQSSATHVRIGVLLGSGDQHGPAALDWTLDGLGRLDGSWPMRFPAPHGTRTVHRFPFSDQYTLPHTVGITAASTGLCLDSRLTTALLTAAGRPAIVRLLRQPRIRRGLLKLLTRAHLGGTGFSVTAQAGTAQAWFSGYLQSRATGLTAALLIDRLPAFPPGVAHIEQLVDPGAFLATLAGHGFTFKTGPAGDPHC